jgi:hypothetical protein
VALTHPCSQPGPWRRQHPSAKKMPIQLSPLLHHHLLKRLWMIGDKLWKIGVRQVSFLQVFFRRCLSLIVDRFMSKYRRTHPSTPYDRADHHSRRLFDDVNCFRNRPMWTFSRWQRPQSLPLHHEELYYHPDPQMSPSTSRAVVPYSTTPTPRDNMSMSSLDNPTCSGTISRAGDPPGLSKELSDFQVVGITSATLERYEKNFTWYVLTTDQQL